MIYKYSGILKKLKNLILDDPINKIYSDTSLMSDSKTYNQFCQAKCNADDSCNCHHVPDTPNFQNLWIKDLQHQCGRCHCRRCLLTNPDVVVRFTDQTDQTDRTELSGRTLVRADCERWQQYQKYVLDEFYRYDNVWGKLFGKAIGDTLMSPNCTFSTQYVLGNYCITCGLNRFDECNCPNRVF